MNNIFKILSVFIFCFLLASCGEDETTTTPLRDYAEQSAADIDSIDDYIDTHYMTVDPTTFDVTFTEIPTGGTQQSIRTQTLYPLKAVSYTHLDVYKRQLLRNFGLTAFMFSSVNES